MGSKKKSPKKAVGARTRKVGAVVMKHRGAKARLKSALRSSGKDDYADAAGGAPEVNGDQGKDGKGLKRHISRIKTKTKSITSKLAKPGARRGGAK